MIYTIGPSYLYLPTQDKLILAIGFAFLVSLLSLDTDIIVSPDTLWSYRYHLRGLTKSHHIKHDEGRGKEEKDST